MSTDRAWTDGPWKVFTTKDGSKIIGIGEHTGEGVADCGFGVWRGGSDEALATAHLIAAAPDLYEALELLHDNIAEYARINNLGGFDNHDMKMARAALSKANGATS